MPAPSRKPVVAAVGVGGAAEGVGLAAQAERKTPSTRDMSVWLVMHSFYAPDGHAASDVASPRAVTRIS